MYDQKRLWVDTVLMKKNVDDVCVCSEMMREEGKERKAGEMGVYQQLGESCTSALVAGGAGSPSRPISNAEGAS